MNAHQDNQTLNAASPRRTPNPLRSGVDPEAVYGSAALIGDLAVQRITSALPIEVSGA